MKVPLCFQWKKSNRRAIAGVVVLAAVAFTIPGCKEDAAPTDVPSTTTEVDAYLAHVWFTVVYNRVRADAVAPPQASRVYGYFGVTLYEAIVGGSSRHRSVATQLNGALDIPPGSDEYHWPTVANNALATVMGSLLSMPNSQTAIAETKSQFDVLYGSEPLYTASIARGQEIGVAIVAWANADGYASRPTAYTPCTDPGCWEPTPPGFLPALEPGWRTLRPFVIASGSSIVPGPPPAFSEDSSSVWYEEAMEVYTTTGDLGANLTTEQNDIALFWADGPGATGTPPGHSMYICMQVAQQMNLNLFDAGEAYARVAVSVADAFITCWYAKFDTQLMRPVTYIQRYIDANWDPLLTTPNFPTYTSGHSTETSASARVMADLWGDSVTFTDHTHDSRGLSPRTFNSFTEAAMESAISRLYGGIQYQFDNDDGFAQGQEVGAQVSALIWRQTSVAEKGR